MALPSDALNSSGETPCRAACWRSSVSTAAASLPMNMRALWLICMSARVSALGAAVGCEDFTLCLVFGDGHIGAHIGDVGARRRYAEQMPFAVSANEYGRRRHWSGLAYGVVKAVVRALECDALAAP